MFAEDRQQSCVMRIGSGGRALKKPTFISVYKLQQRQPLKAYSTVRLPGNEQRC